MKNTTLAFTLLITFLTTTLSAQEVFNQTEQLKTLKTGKYILFEIQKNKSGNYNYLDTNGDHELLEVNQEPNFHEHKYFKFRFYGNDKNYIPDNMAFPTTYAQLYYEGNDKLKQQVGYVPREIRPGSTHQVCIVDGIIFNFNSDFRNGDSETYVPFNLFIHETFGEDYLEADKKGKEGKKKKLSLKEKMEQAMMKKMANKNPEMKARYNSMQKLKAMDAVSLVQDYLKKAVAKQKAMESKWQQEPKNSERVKMVEERRELMLAAMKKYNEDLMDTPEWKRIQENNRLADAVAARDNVTLNNETGRDIYIYEAGSLNGSRISNGARSTFNCQKTYYYAFDGNSGTRGGNAGPLAYSANSSCGGTVTVN
ncbi:MAG: hypothetical protein Mars2KO_41620 [Maribacter sp.]